MKRFSYPSCPLPARTMQSARSAAASCWWSARHPAWQNERWGFTWWLNFETGTAISELPPNRSVLCDEVKPRRYRRAAMPSYSPVSVETNESGNCVFREWTQGGSLFVNRSASAHYTIQRWYLSWNWARGSNGSHENLQVLEFTRDG